MGNLLAEAIIILVGFLYPAYMTFKSMRSVGSFLPRPSTQSHWLTVWSVLGLYYVVVDCLLSPLVLDYLPFASECKAVAVCWIVLGWHYGKPRTRVAGKSGVDHRRGAVWLFRQGVGRGYWRDVEREVDYWSRKVQRWGLRGKNAVVLVGVTIVIAIALTAKTRNFRTSETEMLDTRVGAENISMQHPFLDTREPGMVPVLASLATVEPGNIPAVHSTLDTGEHANAAIETDPILNTDERGSKEDYEGDDTTVRRSISGTDEPRNAVDGVENVTGEATRNATVYVEIGMRGKVFRFDFQEFRIRCVWLYDQWVRPYWTQLKESFMPYWTQLTQALMPYWTQLKQVLMSYVTQLKKPLMVYLTQLNQWCTPYRARLTDEMQHTKHNIQQWMSRSR